MNLNCNFNDSRCYATVASQNDWFWTKRNFNLIKKRSTDWDGNSPFATNWNKTKNQIKKGQGRGTSKRFVLYASISSCMPVSHLVCQYLAAEDKFKERQEVKDSRDKETKTLIGLKPGWDVHLMWWSYKNPCRRPTRTTQRKYYVLPKVVTSIN